MKMLISGLHRMQLRRVVTVFLAGLAVLLSVAVGAFNGVAPAQAAPAQTSAAPVRQTLDQDKAVPEAADSESGPLSNIREKLNLDEPLPESTKLFFKQVQGEDVEVEEPIPSGKSNKPLQ